MKLSEAILEGCKNTEKCKGFLFRGDHKACAMGAALYGYDNRYPCIYKVEEIFPILNFPLDDIPEELCSKEVRGLGGKDILRDAIVHLNDKCDWSRQAIALWISTIEEYLESQEEAQPQKQPEQPQTQPAKAIATP